MYSRLTWMYLIITVIVWLFVPAVASASHPSSFAHELEQSLPAYMARYNVPGVSVAIIEDGEIVYLKSYGLTDRDSRVPMTPDTVHQVASVSKNLTAWSVMKLVDEGLVGLDDPVESHLTRWHIPPSPYDASGVTIPPSSLDYHLYPLELYWLKDGYYVTAQRRQLAIGIRTSRGGMGLPIRLNRQQTEVAKDERFGYCDMRPDAGDVELFGKSLHRGRISLLRRVGALAESPSLYPHLTGRENLEVTRRLIGGRRERIDDALRIVRLQDAAGRRVKAYSTGMRQRLGLALALLGEPKLLILDEPTNGLDPAGIREMRTLITRLPEEHGISVFLSSHLLSEVEQVATHIGIVDQGVLLFQGALEALQAQLEERVSLGVDRPQDAARLLSQAGWSVERNGKSQLYVAVNGQSDVAMINAQLTEGGVNVFQLSLEKPSLEDVFLTLTHEDWPRRFRMIPLTRALWAEMLKMKRTLALWLAIIIPLSIVALQFFIVYQRGEHWTGQAADAWVEFGQQMFLFWVLLALPLFIALETALLGGLEHQGNQWKHLGAPPGLCCPAGDRGLRIPRLLGQG